MGKISHSGDLAYREFLQYMTTLVVKMPNLQQLVGEITWGHNILRQTRSG
ncbi:MAG: hypothetical protein GDA48_05885 [Hormoscilla sp. GM102CHS1]|nr:hypothetical protein [Hormoscilla sp. GM102CHS1]